MICKIMRLVLPLAYSICSMAQPVFRDDFDRDNNWKKSDTRTVAVLDAGILKLNTIGKGATVYTHSVKARADNDFSISASIKIEAGTGSAGLTWGSQRNHYAFLVNPEGKAYCNKK